MTWLWPLVLGVVGCERPECAPVDYRTAECRRQAEISVAEGVSGAGVQLRFDGPLGRVSQRDGTLVARVATLGNVRLEIRRAQSVATSVRVELHNVHPLVEPLLGEVERRGLMRILDVPLTDDVVVVQGQLPASACDAGFELVAVGDVQTGTLVFEELVEDLHREAADAAARGTPLVGVLLLGDLSEDGSLPELERVDAMLRGSPVPVAVTPGNHDVYNKAQPVFTQVYGPGSYAFDVCDARVVMLDSGSADLAPSVQGRLPRLLGHDQRFLIAGTHIPPYAADTANGFRREDQAHHLLAELSARTADVILAGHIHARMDMTGAPVRQVIVGTAGGSQGQRDPDYGYLRMVFRDRMQLCFVPLPAPGSAGVDGKLPPDC